VFAHFGPLEFISQGESAADASHLTIEVLRCGDFDRAECKEGIAVAFDEATLINKIKRSCYTLLGAVNAAFLRDAGCISMMFVAHNYT